MALQRMKGQNWIKVIIKASKKRRRRVMTKKTAKALDFVQIKESTTYLTKRSPMILKLLKVKVTTAKLTTGPMKVNAIQIFIRELSEIFLFSSFYPACSESC